MAEKHDTYTDPGLAALFLLLFRVESNNAGKLYDDFEAQLKDYYDNVFLKATKEEQEKHPFISQIGKIVSAMQEPGLAALMHNAHVSLALLLTTLRDLQFWSECGAVARQDIARFGGIKLP